MSPAVTLAQIARYAQVQRPSVTNWRRRHDDFPQPLDISVPRLLFDAEQVAQWLDRRHPPSGRDAGDPTGTSYGLLFRAALRRAATGPAGADAEADLAVALALVTLRTAHGSPLPADPPALVAIADSVEAAHPGLAGLFEVVRAPGAVDRRLLDQTDRLVSELGPGGSAEEVIAEAGRQGWAGARDETPPAICDLVIGLTAEWLGELKDLVVADLAAGPGRLLAGFCAAGGPREIRFAESMPARSAQLRLRLWCHGQAAPAAVPEGRVTGEFTGSDVVFAHPSFQSGEHADSDEHPLSWATRVVECLDDSAGGVDDRVGFVVVPDWTLTRTTTSTRLPVVWTREQLVRRGCVRAVIQLPRRIDAYRAATDLALLVLGPDRGETSRGVIVCDADQIRNRVGAGWVAETIRLVCGPPSERDPRLCRAVPGAELLSRQSLLPAHVLIPGTTKDDHFHDANRARGAAMTAFRTGVDATGVLDRISLVENQGSVTYRTIGELLRSQQLGRLPGHRIPTDDLGSRGQRVFGREEMLDQVPLGRRRIDIVTLGRYAAATVTERGDVIVMAGEQLRVTVDDRGGSVLLAPVQGLRIPGLVRHSSVFRDEPQAPWIGPYALAALLGSARNAARGGPRVRRVSLDQFDIPSLTTVDYEHLNRAAQALAELTDQTRRQADALDLARRRLAGAVADGALTLRLR